MEIITYSEAKTKGLPRYFNGKPCKHGHISERYTCNRRCIGCNKSEESQAYLKKWKSENKDYMVQWRKDNAEHERVRKQEWYLKNRDSERLRIKQWCEDNKDRRNERRRERYANEKEFKTTMVCRNLLSRVLALTGANKTTSTEEMLGYSASDLISHIEECFLEGMSWDNYGEWHIDHAYPLSRYVRDGVHDPLIINSLDNLIPMWSQHNWQKDTRTLEEYLEEYKEVAELYEYFLERRD